MGNLFTQNKTINDENLDHLDHYDHYAVNGQNLAEITEMMKMMNVNHYKYHNLFDEKSYYIAFQSKYDIRRNLPNSWQPTAAPFRWFLKNGREYMDVYINNPCDSWYHYAVSYTNLSQIENDLKSNQIFNYKYWYNESLQNYYVTFQRPNCAIVLKLPIEWSLTVASFEWFLKNGKIYTDVQLSY